MSEGANDDSKEMQLILPSDAELAAFIMALIGDATHSDA